MTALEAIEQSIRENRIVYLDGASLSRQDVYQLNVDCDDSVVNGDVTEYWGESTDDEGPKGPWRVHVTGAIARGDRDIELDLGGES